VAPSIAAIPTNWGMAPLWNDGRLTLIVLGAGETEGKLVCANSRCGDLVREEPSGSADQTSYRSSEDFATILLTILEYEDP